MDWCNTVFLWWVYFLIKPESKLWHNIRDNIKNVEWTRFENWAVPGVPDVHGICKGVNVFIELKITKNNKLNLSPFQIAWNYKHILNGGRAFIIALTISRTALCVLPCSSIRSIASKGLEAKPVYTYKIPLNQQDWTEIHELLFHSPFPAIPKE